MLALPDRVVVAYDAPARLRPAISTSIRWRNSTRERAPLPDRADQEAGNSWKRPQSSETAASLIDAELVVSNEDLRHRASLPIQFTRRLVSDTEISLLGADASQSLHLALVLNLQTHTSSMRFSLEAMPAASPMELRSIVDWIAAAQPGTLVGVRSAANNSWIVPLQGQSVQIPDIPLAYRHALSALARIQHRSGTSFSMPTSIDADDARSIDVADQLLRGLTVAGTWSSATISDDPELREFLAHSPHGVMLEFKTDHSMRLGAQDVLIGEVEYRFTQAKPATHRPSGAGLALAPGRSDRFELRLVSVPEREHADGTAAWVPPALTAPYTGSWVAQSGTKILQYDLSLELVVAKLRASGKLATVWRVPEPEEVINDWPGEML